MTRRCRQCETEKPESEFTTNGHPPDRVTQAFRPDCKRCRAEKRRAAYAARTAHEVEHDKQLKAESYQRNRETYAASALAWKKANPVRSREIMNAAAKRLREGNPEKARAKGRRDQLARRIGRRPADVSYAEMLLRDPCSYCGEAAGTIDHIVPLARGGTNGGDNLTAACLSCNARKRDRSLLEFLAA